MECGQTAEGNKLKGYNDSLKVDNRSPPAYTEEVRTLELIIPDGATEGDVLTFSVGGSDFDVPVPEGSRPGDVLQIQIGVFAGAEDGFDAGDGVQNAAAEDCVDVTKLAKNRINDGDEEENGFSVVPLHSSLRIGLRFIATPSACTVTKISTGVESCSDLCDGTHSVGPWPTALLFCRLVTSPELSNQLLKGRKKVLEIGSGTGACGLAIAVTLAGGLIKRDNIEQGCAGKDNPKVLLTDVPASLSLLKANAKENQRITTGVDVAVSPLIWGDGLPTDSGKICDVRSQDKFDLIVGSDLLYGPESSYKPLAETVNSYLRSDSGIMLLAVRWRQPSKEKSFFRLMDEMGYVFVLLDRYLDDLLADRCKKCDDSSFRDGDDKVCFKGVSETLPCMLDWREYGDIDNEAFVKYTMDTKVSVKRKPVFLVDLQEEDLEKMDDKEHDEFERTQTQIYVGFKAHSEPVQRMDDKKRSSSVFMGTVSTCLVDPKIKKRK